jgi:hypothetical protein
MYGRLGLAAAAEEPDPVPEPAPEPPPPPPPEAWGAAVSAGAGLQPPAEMLTAAVQDRLDEYMPESFENLIPRWEGPHSRRRPPTWAGSGTVSLARGWAAGNAGKAGLEPAVPPANGPGSREYAASSPAPASTAVTSSSKPKPEPPLLADHRVPRAWRLAVQTLLATAAGADAAADAAEVRSRAAGEATAVASEAVNRVSAAVRQCLKREGARHVNYQDTFDPAGEAWALTPAAFHCYLACEPRPVAAPQPASKPRGLAALQRAAAAVGSSQKLVITAASGQLPSYLARLARLGGVAVAWAAAKHGPSLEDVARWQELEAEEQLAKKAGDATAAAECVAARHKLIGRVAARLGGLAPAAARGALQDAGGEGGHWSGGRWRVEEAAALAGAAADREAVRLASVLSSVAPWRLRVLKASAPGAAARAAVEHG